MNVSVPELREKVTKFSEALGELGAVASGEVIGAMSKLLTETNSYEESAARASLAMKIHTNTSYTFADALAIVDKTARGQTRGIQQLTGTIIQGTDAHDKAAKGLEVLEKKFGDMKVALSDEAASLERSEANWKNFKEAVGTVALKAVSNFIENIREMPLQMQHAEDIAAAVFHAIGGYIETAAVWIKNIYTKSWAESSAEAQAGFKKTGEVFAAEQTAADAALKTSGEKRAAELNVQLTKELGLHVHANAMIAKDDKEVGETRLAHANSEYAEIEKLERLREAEDVARSARAIAREKKEQAERFKIIEASNRWIIQANEEKGRALKQAADNEAKIALNLAKTKLELEASAISGGLQMAGDAFGIKKEIALTESVINTYVAAVKALAEGGGWPAGAVMMFATIATGLVEVAAIAAQSQPSMPGMSAATVSGLGFDDPTNDAAAYQGGRKWAADMIGKFSGGASSGVSAGWSSGMGGGSTVNNNNRTTNINVTGAQNPNDRASLVRLGRQLAIAMKSDSQRVIAGRT
jgi:hypothetical protein